MSGKLDLSEFISKESDCGDFATLCCMIVSFRLLFMNPLRRRPVETPGRSWRWLSGLLSGRIVFSRGTPSRLLHGSLGSLRISSREGTPCLCVGLHLRICCTSDGGF